MCKSFDTVPVRVKIPSDLSCSGVEHWKLAQIDRCIAPLVEALQAGGIDMRGSCCGHGRRQRRWWCPWSRGEPVGYIQLQDGRLLRILDAQEAVGWLSGLKR